MKGLNSVTIGGNCVADAELRATASGTSVLSFRVAVNESRKTDDGWEDYPNYIDCTMFGSRAERLSRYIRKGTYVALTGRLHQSRWQGKQGESRSRLEVTVDEIHFESRKAQDDMDADDLPF